MPDFSGDMIEIEIELSHFEPETGYINKTLILGSGDMKELLDIEEVIGRFSSSFGSMGRILPIIVGRGNMRELLGIEEVMEYLEHGGLLPPSNLFVGVGDMRSLEPVGVAPWPDDNLLELTWDADVKKRGPRLKLLSIFPMRSS